MPAVTMTLTIRVPPGVVERVDACRGGVSRNAWFVWAAEQALGSDPDPVGGEGAVAASARPTPAEQPEVQRAVRGAREMAARAGGLVGQLLEDAADAVEQPGTSEAERKSLENFAREFRPYPKGGKR